MDTPHPIPPDRFLNDHWHTPTVVDGHPGMSESEDKGRAGQILATVVVAIALLAALTGLYFWLTGYYSHS